MASSQYFSQMSFKQKIHALELNFILAKIHNFVRDLRSAVQLFNLKHRKDFIVEGWLLQQRKQSYSEKMSGRFSSVTGVSCGKSQ